MNYARGFWNAASTQRHKEIFFLKQPLDNPLASDTRTKSKPSPKRQRVWGGRERRGPGAGGARVGHGVGDLLQYSTRWCCILEITASWVPSCWMQAQRCGKHTQAPFEKRCCALFKESMDFPFCLFIAQELIETMNL